MSMIGWLHDVVNFGLDVMSMTTGSDVVVGLMSVMGWLLDVVDVGLVVLPVGSVDSGS